MAQSTLKEKIIDNKFYIYKYNEVVLCQEAPGIAWYAGTIIDADDENINKELTIRWIDPDNHWTENGGIITVTKSNLLPFSEDNLKATNEEYPIPSEEIEYYNNCIKIATIWKERNEKEQKKIELEEKLRYEELQNDLYTPNIEEKKLVKLYHNILYY